jgi:subtilisin family serine protease
LGLALLCLLVVGGVPAYAGHTAPSPTKAHQAVPGAVPGQLLVGFGPHSTHAAQAAAVHAAGGQVLRRFGPINVALVGISGPRGRAVAALRAQHAVRFAEPNFIVHTDAVPNDPSFSSQWGLRNTGQTVNFYPGTAGDDIHAPSAWDVTTGSRAVKVGVLDTGVDLVHPDLAPNIWSNPGESCPGCGTNGVDDDGNGFADDVHGWNCLAGSNDPSDDNGHGTHVSGILGAAGNNGRGVTGVNWQVGIVPIKFIGAGGSGTTADAICGILYGISAGVNVINASWGDTEYSQALYDAIAQADQHGVLFVAAAGNDGQNNDTTPHYPASYDLPNVISVAATESNDNETWFTDYGQGSVDIGAPGQNILSTWPGGGYQYEDGTSMATPFVAGAAALVKAAFPDASAMGTKALLLQTADPTASLTGDTTSGGRLDLSAAVHCSGNGEVWIDSPSQGFVAAAGQAIPVRVIASRCASPTGVTVSASGNGAPIDLTPRGDGLYTGTYLPASAGPVTIQASATAVTTSTETVSGTVPQTIVAGGAPVTVSMPTVGQKAILAFAGTAGQRISAAVTNATIKLATISIRNPDGTSLGSSTMFGTGGGFVDTRTLAQTGTYTITVAPYSTYTGSATVTLYDVPPDVTGPIAADGSATGVSIATPGQNARLTFSGAAGGRISLSVGSSTISSAYVSILNPDGTTLGSQAIFGTAGTFLDVRTLPQTGTYTVFVNPNSSYTGATTLNLYTVPPDLLVAGSAGGAAVGLSLTTPGQNGRITFTGSAGQRVSVQLTSDTIKQAYVSILKPDGTGVGSQTLMVTGGGFVDTRTLPVAGTYTVLVDPNTTATGSTQVTIYDVPPDASAAITPGGAPVTLATTTPGQNAVATFAGTAGRRVSLSLGSVTMAQGKVSILNPDGSTLAPVQFFGTGGGFVDVRSLPATGTYQIVVDPQSTYTGQARLTLYDVPADPAPGTVIGGAGAVVSTPVPGQNATVTFTAAAGQALTVKLTASTYSLAKVALQNPDGSTLVGARYFGTGGTTFTATTGAAGTYTITLDPQQAYTGGVTVTVTSP